MTLILNKVIGAMLISQLHSNSLLFILTSQILRQNRNHRKFILNRFALVQNIIQSQIKPNQNEHSYR
jgi:hypothetical protein